MLLPGTPAPEFRLPLTTGRSQTLGSQLRAGAVLLAFFKVSCPVCQFTLPYLQKLAAKLAALGISQDDSFTATEFSRAFGLTLPIVIDNASAGYPVSNAFEIASVPSLFLVEPGGVIGASFQGFSRSELEDIAARFDVPLFERGEKVPEFRPG